MGTYNMFLWRKTIPKLSPNTPGFSLGSDLGEKVSLRRLTSPCFELREKFECIEHIGKSKIWTKTSPRKFLRLKALGWLLYLLYLFHWFLHSFVLELGLYWCCVWLFHHGCGFLKLWQAVCGIRQNHSSWFHQWLIFAFFSKAKKKGMFTVTCLEKKDGQVGIFMPPRHRPTGGIERSGCPYVRP